MFEEGINHPLAIVAILSMVLGFLGLAFREFTWWFKSMKQTTPSDHIQKSNIELARGFEAINQNLVLLNASMKHHAELSQEVSRTILHEIRTLRSSHEKP